MKELKKRIPLKYLYVLSTIIAILLSVGLYYTYAMFTANVTSGNIVNMDTTLNYTFDVSGTQNFHVGKNSIASFNFIVNNSSNGSIYYEIYYSTNNDLTDVIIGEVVEDKNTTTLAPNTSGNIDKDNRKTIPLVIANNSNNDIDVVIGVVTGYVGNTINYGTDNYPNGTKIISTYNSSDITNSCEGGSNVGTDCIEKAENGRLKVYCITSDTELQEDPSGANRPVLAEGMIPITYDGSKWVKADEYGAYNNWYDYGKQKWANAVMVTSTKRETYMNADVGTVVPEADILAYFVWIPRYKYKLFNATYTSGTTEQLIEVTFENGTSTTGTVTCTYASNGAETCQNKANGNWYTHPAFTLGDTELKGIWVGKFEVSSDIECLEKYTTYNEGCNSTTINPRILPNVKPWHYAQYITYYTNIRKIMSTVYLTTKGVEKTDAHMIKNIEWGAITYLKQSIYGLGITDIGKNNNSSYITGCGAVAGSNESSTCNAYNTANGKLASTTGNINGVYDMSGGSGEYVMGNYNNVTGSSGFTMSNINNKYKDIYNGGSVASSHLGDALGETAEWYHSKASFVLTGNNSTWFYRGGDASYDASIFSFDWTSGSTDRDRTSRVVLSITE